MKNVWTSYGIPYPGEYPQEPYKPREPERKDYIGKGASKEKCIYSDFEILREDVNDDDEEFWEGQGYDEGEAPKKAKIGIRDHLTLQDILDLMPPGAEPKDIVFNLSYPRYVDYISVSFNYWGRNLEAEEKAYQKDLKKYQHDLADYNEKYAQFQKDKEAYDKWINEQEIKQLEEKLAKLKK